MGATTLILLDVQNGIIDMLGRVEMEPYLEHLASALSAARSSGIKVIHVITAFRPGYPEAHPTNASFAHVMQHGLFQVGDPAIEVHAAVAPTPEEPVVTKRRVSAFTGTELEMILRCTGSDHIVVAGLITRGGAVDCAIGDGFGFADYDEEVHRVLMDKVFERKAEVITGKDWAAKLTE
ncbi:hypothetical protein N7468_004868 [Penicillium chermesinum]|uniref:Isochorismatase-like domain-containing protein n=1 Tax=Penicillium chermesinum TaxID=63820 RepID=A0A9W9TUR8_9EURO|nr:uncharacterized protein N7468_004868 [Penicillium chermesinum]KAJ5240249.1 hypothetical protein N7468_004868 [Penicillium chermesinum]